MAEADSDLGSTQKQILHFPILLAFFCRRSVFAALSDNQVVVGAFEPANQSDHRDSPDLCDPALRHAPDLDQPHDLACDRGLRHDQENHLPNCYRVEEAG